MSVCLSVCLTYSGFLPPFRVSIDSHYESHDRYNREAWPCSCASVTAAHCPASVPRTAARTARQICFTSCHRLLILPIQSGCGLSSEGFGEPLLPFPVNQSSLLCVCGCFLENMRLMRVDCHHHRRCCCHCTAACSSIGTNKVLVQTIKLK